LENKPKFTKISVDDGTGVIDCIEWKMKFDGGVEVSSGKDVLSVGPEGQPAALGMCVCVQVRCSGWNLMRYCGQENCTLQHH
jgi:hypothetical protein